MRTTILAPLLTALALVPVAACSKTANAVVAERSDPLAPLACLRNAKARSGLDLKVDYMVQLCSGATDATSRIECYVAARADASLDMSSEGALMLCSPFNLDAFNAKKLAD
jgi:hypothetical protein